MERYEALVIAGEGMRCQCYWTKNEVELTAGEVKEAEVPAGEGMRQKCYLEKE